MQTPDQPEDVVGFAEAITDKALTGIIDQLGPSTTWTVHYVLADLSSDFAIGPDLDWRLTVEIDRVEFDHAPDLDELAQLDVPATTVAAILSRPDGTMSAVSGTGATALRVPAGTTPPVGPAHLSRDHDRARRLLRMPGEGPPAAPGQVLSAWWHQLASDAGLNGDTVALRPDLVLGSYAKHCAASTRNDPADPAVAAVVLRALLAVGDDPPVDRRGLALLAADGFDVFPTLYRLAVRPVLVAGQEPAASDAGLDFLDGPSSAFELFSSQQRPPGLLTANAARSVAALRNVPAPAARR